VLTFFAQDGVTHTLVYANADLTKATQASEVLAFCDHWRSVSGRDLQLLVFDFRVTTQKTLGTLDARGVRFLTLRMRTAALTAPEEPHAQLTPIPAPCASWWSAAWATRRPPSSSPTTAPPPPRPSSSDTRGA
jgi:hypothetical protein